MQKIYIRADGNSQIGVGHQMRCLSIADAMRESGNEIIFLVADESGSVLPKSRGYDCIVLESDYRAPEEEIPKLRELMKGSMAGRKPLLILDSYFIRPEYLQNLRENAFLIYMDDYGREHFPADCIINYNIYGPDMPYDALYSKDEDTKPLLLLGSQYAPLRAAFCKTTHIAKNEVTDVLITTGGADKYNVAGQLAERLTRTDGEEQETEAEWKTDAHAENNGRHPGIRYHVISGTFHKFRGELEKLAAERKDIIVHENVTEMAELMAQCDLAVSAAGSTLYELCAVRVPAIYFYFVENQLLPAKYFAKKTKMISCGNFADKPEETLAQLYNAVRRLEKDCGLREKIAASMNDVTDGSGAERIAACLRKQFQTNGKNK